MPRALDRRLSHALRNPVFVVGSQLTMSNVGLRDHFLLANLGIVLFHQWFAPSATNTEHGWNGLSPHDVRDRRRSRHKQ